MRKILYFILILVSGYTAYAQSDVRIFDRTNEFWIFYERDRSGNLNFFCTNNHHCNYVLELKIQGCRKVHLRLSNPLIVELRPGRNFLFTLKYKCENLQWSSKFTKGCLNPKIDTYFNYLLPISNYKTTQVFNIDYLKTDDNSPEPIDFYQIGFKTNAGDIIYASRRGVVSSLKETSNIEMPGISYSTDENHIEIFHNDCSFGRYSVFSKALVELGQEVEAGDPIAIAGGENYTSGSHVRFYVYYYDYSNKNIAKSEITPLPSKPIRYLPLKFYTQEIIGNLLTMNETYTCIKPKSIITQEMTNKQIKRWKNKNNRTSF